MGSAQYFMASTDISLHNRFCHTAVRWVHPGFALTWGIYRDCHLWQDGAPGRKRSVQCGSMKYLAWLGRVVVAAPCGTAQGTEGVVSSVDVGEGPKEDQHSVMYL